MTDNADYEFSVSPQMLVSCSLNYYGGEDLGGCDGGDSRSALKYLSEKKNSLLHESCMPYLATNGTCVNKCFDILHKGGQIEANMAVLDKVHVKNARQVGTWIDLTNTTKSKPEIDAIIAANT